MEKPDDLFMIEMDMDMRELEADIDMNSNQMQGLYDAEIFDWLINCADRLINYQCDWWLSKAKISCGLNVLNQVGMVFETIM